MKKRIESFLWRAGMMSLAAGVSFAVGHFQELGLSPLWTGVIGLGLGEVSKALNNYVNKY